MKCFKHPEKDAVGACVYCGKLYCSDCLVEVKGKMYCKDDLSKVFDEAKEQSKQNFNPMVFMNAGGSSSSSSSSAAVGINQGQQGLAKSKITALLLCIFLGWLGAHRFYVGKVGTGIIYLLTMGFLGVGIILDIVLIIMNSFRDKWGNPLV